MQKSIDLKAALLDSFTKQKFCDVTFTCKESKSNKWIKVGAHKAVLASVSDVFETMFFGEIVLNDGVSKEAEIKIEDIHMEAFQSFLGFIYGEKITFDCADIALNFLYAADKYNSDEAKKFIEAYILKDVGAHNAITYYETADMMSLSLLKIACVDIFEEKTVEVLCYPNFVNAKPETLHAIFNLNCHNTTEFGLVWALERYINFNKLKDPEIADKIRPALSCIRFLTMEKKDVALTALLTEEEKKNIMEKSLKEDQGLSMCCSERGIAGTMKMMQTVQPYYSDQYCSKCISTKRRADHPFWLCAVIDSKVNSPVLIQFGATPSPSFGFGAPTMSFNIPIEEKAKLTLKKMYDKYHHTFLPAYKPSDVKKLYEVFQTLNWI